MEQLEQYLRDRVAIVTGASSGIGRVIANDMARRGAKVMLTSNEPERLQEALEEVRPFSPDSAVQELDAASAESVAALVEATMQRYGRIDILVNNAGITRDSLLMRMSDADWDAVLAVNLTSIFRLTRLVVRPMLKARYGRIVNMASIVGLTGNAGQANYAAAKGGLIAFTKTVALEVASRGVTANCVAPGFIQTRMTDALNPEARKAMLGRIPLGEMGQPQDVSSAVLFLASDYARYITGETLSVNGGMHM